jgi:cytidylate kinase
MTCCKKCRLCRRAKQEKARREADLPTSRLAEQVRQREHRLRKCEEAAARPVSRAGLSAQATASIEEIIENLRHAQRVSQAGLRRQLHRLAKLGRGEAEQASPKTET